MMPALNDELTMFKFTILGIPVTVQWWFFLLAAFLGGGLGAQTSEAVQRVLVFMAAAFLSILVHEFGHALTGRFFGARKVEIELHGLGGVARFPGASFSRGQSILVTAAGPGASIALAVLFFVIAMVVYREGEATSFGASPLNYFLGTMMTINIFWSVFNLCPILPLDGGQILRDILGPARIKLTCIIGFITLGLLGVVLWTMTRSIYNMILLAFLGSYTLRVFQAASR